MEELAPDKVAALEKKLASMKQMVHVDKVPDWMYKRAQLEEIDGETVPVFKKVRTKTIITPASKIDEIIHQVSNTSEDVWGLRDIVPVAKRPGKVTGADFFLLMFVGVDTIILPLPEEEPDASGAIEGVDAETLKKAEEWESKAVV